MTEQDLKIGDVLIAKEDGLILDKGAEYPIISYDDDDWLGLKIESVTRYFNPGTIFNTFTLKEKHKNNFKEYGFEADFEGEILKVLKDHNDKKYYIGYTIDVREGLSFPYPKTWTEDGKCFDDDDNILDDFNLIPLVKPWYEDESNKGRLIINKHGEVRVIQYIGTGKVATHKQNLYSDAIYADGWRLLDNEEIEKYKR